jgi:hypothetical protein
MRRFIITKIWSENLKGRLGRLEPLADCFEHGNEPSGSTKGEEYVD